MVRAMQSVLLTVEVATKLVRQLPHVSVTTVQSDRFKPVQKLGIALTQGASNKEQALGDKRLDHRHTKALTHDNTARHTKSSVKNLGVFH